MSSPAERPISSADSRLEEMKQSPPAFLDLADSAARLGGNLTDLTARVELKRQEHERQRALQRKIFEDQMRALEHQQHQELLNIPQADNGAHNIAVSAPTTPPRLNAGLHGEHSPEASFFPDSGLQPAATTRADKRKSVTYGATITMEPASMNPVGHQNGHSSFARSAGAKSMPASRRTSASEHDEDLAEHLHGLSMVDTQTRLTPSQSVNILRSNSGRFTEGPGTYNAGMMLDEQLDKEMHNAMRNLPTSDEDKSPNQYSNSKLSTASAALDLAPLSQTPPRSNTFGGRPGNEKASEWPAFSGMPRPEVPHSRAENRRSMTNPLGPLTPQLSSEAAAKLGLSANTTPLLTQHTPASSRRSSPSAMLDSALSLASTQGMPPTPYSDISNPGLMGGKGPGLGAHPAISRNASSQYDGSLSFNSVSSGMDAPYDDMYDLDGFGNGGQGSTALYHHHGSRYGLGMGGARVNGAGGDSKMNGLHGPKHRRGDADREFTVNRFAGTRLEDLQGEIPSLCKDQHGCRYLQKKLEEGIPEHRDLIFHETFNHFAELMTDPFGNYLCQKLLEYSTDDQRNIICESVAQELVNISLNMHGTRAVQKMIDFLSTRRQIHSIIVALSLHVVVLIKDLNGNHVIQKCLNKLMPEDNQFIYNAVAANCVEVATHRHGCCVLQRCIDHASEAQRIQLVDEITYNALTLVQDPYGNYVVQYILDLNDNRFSDAVIRQFTGNVCALSVQKFSSNVIEKCVRVAEHNTRKLLIDELLNRTRLEKLLRDSFGNYCVQTALDYAEPAQRALLVEGIRPILPLIRNTPYGKRIQSKLQREQMELGGGGGGGNSPHYSGYHPQQAALVNLALSSQGLPAHGVVNGRHNGLNASALSGGALADVYTQSQLYALNGGLPSHSQQSVGHGHGHGHHVQQQHISPHSIDGYLLQGNSSHNQGLTSSLAGSSHLHASAGNGFGGMGGFAGNGFGSSVGMASTNDPYQRAAFGYM